MIIRFIDQNKNLSNLKYFFYMEHRKNIADAFITLDKYVVLYKLNQNARIHNHTVGNILKQKTHTVLSKYQAKYFQ